MCGSDVCRSDMCRSDVCRSDMCGSDVCRSDMCRSDVCRSDVCSSEVCVVDSPSLQVCLEHSILLALLTHLLSSSQGYSSLHWHISRCIPSEGDGKWTKYLLD